MLEQFLYAGPREKTIHDGVREFCRNEHWDEAMLRSSYKGSLRAMKLAAKKAMKGMKAHLFGLRLKRKGRVIRA